MATGTQKTVQESQKRTWSFMSHLNRGSGFWVRVCFRGILFFAGLHALYWLPAFPIPDPFRTLLGFFLFFETVFFMGEMGTLAIMTLTLLGLSLAILRIIGIFAPGAREKIGGHFDVPQEGGDGTPTKKWAFRPWVIGMLWTALFFGHLGFDLNPFLTGVCLSGLLLLLPETWTRLQRIWPSVIERQRWIWIALAAIWFLAAPDLAIRIGVVVWILTLLYVTRRMSRWLAFRDRFAFTLLCVPIPQLMSAVLPMMINLHGGESIGDSMAYSFCEADGRIFAAVPRCNPEQYETCQDGTIVEYEARTLKVLREHSFLDPAFTGRVEQLICTDDLVQVGMDYTLVDGEVFIQSAMSFRLDDPSQFTVNDTGQPAGDGLVWDRKRNAGFYTCANHDVIRMDFETREVDITVAKPGKISAVSAVKFHEGRDRLYVAGFYGRVWEVHPETFEVTAEYPILNTWELEVDAEMDRLWAVGNFGLEVVDLKTGKVVARKRISLVGRRPAIDKVNQVVYVPTTAGGRLHAYDRVTLESLGTVVLGSGVRLPFASGVNGHILATNGNGPFRFNARVLAKRLRGELN